MIYYLLLIGLNVFLYFLTNNKNIKKERLFLVLSFLSLFIFAAIRAESTGVDLPIYKMYYSNSTLARTLFEQIKLGYFEVGYIVYNYMLYMLSGGSFRFLLIVTSFLSFCGVYKFIDRYSTNKLLSIIIYICIDYYIFTFSGLRQSISISIICFAYKYIIDRDFKKFILLIIIAFLFHKSSLVFLPAYFLYNFKISGLKHFMMICIIPITYFFRVKIILLLESMVYSSYGIVNNSGEGYKLLFLYSLVLLLISLFKDKFIQNNEINNMMYNFFYAGFILQILATVEGNAYRATKYYMLVLLCVFPNLVNIFSNNTKKNIIYVSIFVLFIAFFIYTNPNLHYDIFFLEN